LKRKRHGRQKSCTYITNSPTPGIFTTCYVFPRSSLSGCVVWRYGIGSWVEVIMVLRLCEIDDEELNLQPEVQSIDHRELQLRAYSGRGVVAFSRRKDLGRWLISMAPGGQESEIPVGIYRIPVYPHNHVHPIL
jgi:hypothetical protein